MTNSFSHPLLLQRLELARPDVVVFVGASAPEMQPAATYQNLHCSSLEEAMQVCTREKLAVAIRQVSPAGASSAVEESSVQEVGGSVVGVLQSDADTHSLDRQLGLAIRLFPEQLFVHCVDSSMGDERFFAFGFRRLTRSANQSTTDGDSRWYEYRLRDYKDQPTWLNARFWANPARFDNRDDPDLYGDEEE